MPDNGLNTAIINYLNASNLRPSSECGGERSKCPDPGLDCMLNPNGGGTCQKKQLPGNEEGGICDARMINDFITTSSSTLSPLNLDAIESIKVNVLQKYSYGQKYIQFYDLISKMGYYFNKINLFNLTQDYDFTKKTQVVLAKFLSPDSNEIPITAEYKAQALSLAKEYKALTTNSYVQAAITTFENDVIRFEGKTVKTNSK